MSDQPVMRPVGWEPPEKPRIAVSQRSLAMKLRDGDFHVGICDFCQALIWPGEESARLHVENAHGGEL